MNNSKLYLTDEILFSFQNSTLEQLKDDIQIKSSETKQDIQAPEIIEQQRETDRLSFSF